MENFVRLWVRGGLQPELLVVDSNHGFRQPRSDSVRCRGLAVKDTRKRSGFDTSAQWLTTAVHGCV